MVHIKKSQSGFTLIEILIVVALLAILAVAMLVALNPASAQQKARDSQRLKDLSTLQAVVEQFVTDNPTVGRTSISTTASGSNACGTAGWFQTDVCSYANILPVDPSNKTTSHASTAGGSATAMVAYQVLINAGNYRICTRMENPGNVGKMTSDGSSNNYYEVYNNTAAGACNF